MFWECRYVKTIYEYVADYFDNNISLNYVNIFTCRVVEPTKHIANYIVLLSKMFIYRCKCESVKPRIQKFVDYIKWMENINRKIAYENNLYKKHNKRWKLIKEKLLN